MQIKEDTRKKIIKWLWIIAAAPFALVLLLLLLTALFFEVPSFEQLEHPDLSQATQIIAEDGEVLATFHKENRTYLNYEDLSLSLVEAAVATEDARFYRHAGIDFKGLARVAVKTLLLGDSSQGGGSTITQQLAKTLFERKEGGKLTMVFTKLKEWITAVKIERDYTKDEIMAMYLNSIFFGSGAYGVKAASETYFAKDPSNLTVEESAMLVGMVNKPTRYNPALNPEFALQRRNFVIGQMEKAGYLTEAERDSIRAIPITLHYEIQDHNAGVAPYFRDMIRRDMRASEPQRKDYMYPEEYTADSLRWAVDPIYGWLKKQADLGRKYNLDTSGLRIYTTINYRMQKYAEEAVAEHLGKSLQKDFDRELKYKRNRPFANDVSESEVNSLMQRARRNCDRWRNGKRAGLNDAQIRDQFSKPVKMRLFAWNTKGYVDTTMTPDDSIRYCKSILRVGFVAIEPGTGHVKAYVGGPNYRFFKFDNCRQGKRQVGSTIKPFLYTLAMMSGYSPCDRAVCAPQTFDMPAGGPWTPHSTDKAEDIGTIQTLKWGLAHSSNNFSAFLMKKLGPYGMVNMVHQMGVPDHLDEVYSLCVGAAEVEVFNMVAAYNTFPSGGQKITPVFVTRIEDNKGNVITEIPSAQREMAIPASVDYTMINMMKGVVNEGTGSRLRRIYGLTGELAGKTGTTNDCTDGWFIGYSPKITAGVWVGAEDPQVHFSNGSLGQGANMALPIWGIWYRKCLADHTLGLSPDDHFILPPDAVSASMDCSDGLGTFLGGYGGDDGSGDNIGEHDSEEDYYFN